MNIRSEMENRLEVQERINVVIIIINEVDSIIIDQLRACMHGKRHSGHFHGLGCM